MRYLCMGYRKQAKESPTEREPVFKGLGEYTFKEFFRACNVGGKPFDEGDACHAEQAHRRRNEDLMTDYIAKLGHTV